MTTRSPAATAVRFFTSAADFRGWLQRQGERTAELWIGFYTRASARSGITYSEALDEALCFDWIDGVDVKADADTYTHRFSHHKPGSAWSAANLRRFDVLRARGRVTPTGMRVFEARNVAASGYAIADRPTQLDPALEAALRAEPRAWAYFAAQPPAYRRDAAFLVTGATREETRQRRLATLIADSAAGRRSGAYGGGARAATAQPQPEGR